MERRCSLCDKPGVVGIGGGWACPDHVEEAVAISTLGLAAEHGLDQAATEAMEAAFLRQLPWPVTGPTDN